MWGRDGKSHAHCLEVLIHDNKAMAHGIYLDNYCQNFVVDHNVISNCGAGNRVNSRPRTTDCTTIRCSTAVMSEPAPTTSGPTICLVTGPPAVMGIATDIAKINNLFLSTRPAAQLQDFAVKNLSLKTGAPAIESGKPVTGITEGFLGEAPDLGAYESGGARWLPVVQWTSRTSRCSVISDEPTR